MDDPENPGTTSHMQQIEDSFMGYPTLIYDGPFSDHILDKTPLMTEGKAEVPVDQAKQLANQVAGKDLTEMPGRNSTLPFLCFP